MSTPDALAFSLKLIYSNLDFATLGIAIFIFLATIIVLGLFWGKCWNKQWNLLGNLPAGTLSILLASLLVIISLGWLGGHSGSTWLDRQRDLLTRQLSSSGLLNREGFRRAWDILQPLGGQENLTPPGEGGNELRLNSEEDARVLASSSGDSVKGSLLGQGPFLFGAPCFVGDSSIVAEDVVKTVVNPSYPVIVSPENQWSKAAVAYQVGVAFDSASRALRDPLKDLKTKMILAAIVIILLHLAATALFACGDIKAHPKQ